MPARESTITTDGNPPIIVGAGPVGLAAAVFLARQGIFARVIDSAAGPSPQSRALAVNPRTLEILESTGITDQMLSIGKLIKGVRLTAGTKQIGEMSMSSLPHRYQFMLALSQATTVRLLEAELNRMGLHVEWNREFVGGLNVDGAVDVELKSADGAVQEVRCPWLLAADGARSKVRGAMHVEFPGSSFEKPWYLADVPLSTSLSEELAHVNFLPGGGFLFVFRVIDEAEKERRGDPVWRIIGNFPDPLSRFEAGRVTGPPVWSSDFHISHRIAEELQVGSVYFAGDAAHLHSPIGARGMNLGIEDAWVFSEMLKAGRLAEYSKQRHKVDGRVVRRIEKVSRVVVGESVASRVLRRTVFPMMTRIPIVRKTFLRMATGLDHPLPAPAATPAAGAQQPMNPRFGHLQGGAS